MSARAALLVLFALAGCGGGDGLPSAPRTGAEQAAALQRVAEAANRDGDSANAVALYRSALASRPDWVEPQIGLGRSLLRLGQAGEARTAFAEATRLEPRDQRAIIGAAQADLVERRFEAALQGFEAALQADPANADALNGAGVSLDQLGHHAEAQARYGAVLSREPTNRAARNNLGLSLALGGHAAEAVRVLGDLTQTSSATPRNRQNLAVALALDGHQQEAADMAARDEDPAQAQRDVALLDRIRRGLDREAP